MPVDQRVELLKVQVDEFLLLIRVLIKRFGYQFLRDCLKLLDLVRIFLPVPLVCTHKP